MSSHFTAQIIAWHVLKVTTALTTTRCSCRRPAGQAPLPIQLERYPVIIASLVNTHSSARLPAMIALQGMSAPLQIKYPKSVLLATILMPATPLVKSAITALLATVVLHARTHQTSAAPSVSSVKRTAASKKLSALLANISTLEVARRVLAKLAVQETTAPRALERSTFAHLATTVMIKLCQSHAVLARTARNGVRLTLPAHHARRVTTARQEQQHQRSAQLATSAKQTHKTTWTTSALLAHLVVENRSQVRPQLQINAVPAPKATTALPLKLHRPSSQFHAPKELTIRLKARKQWATA